MTTKTTLLARLLRKHRACEEGREWAESYKTPAAAWEACKSPEWMMWALDAAGLWDDKKGRLLACWCVRNTPLPDGRKVWDLLTDDRSRKAVEVAERFANGEASGEELAAARAAAWAAAWDAARDAAWAAARDAARDAAWDAARDAAWAAARAAARDAAWDAAWAAARDAARDAAWDAAWAAAWDAARDAARAAARDAARAAARDAQASQLRKMFGNPFRDRKVLSRLTEAMKAKEPS